MTTTTSMRSIDLSKNPSDVELYVSHPTVLERPVSYPKRQSRKRSFLIVSMGMWD